MRPAVMIECHESYKTFAGFALNLLILRFQQAIKDFLGFY
jgi:hypothetical protein